MSEEVFPKMPVRKELKFGYVDALKWFLQDLEGRFGRRPS